ncbi:MAG: outer membrane lipoprotein carrier protein LolA [Crocinitomicaceae bacterium]|nr:outer membrane lipoprotein carrier protein LolA [Crocinitomicaceae bacterium]
MKEKVKSEGLFWFKKNSRLKIEYIQPHSYIMVLNNGKVKIKDRGKETSVNSGGSRIFKKLNEIILSCIQGTVFDCGDFTPQVFENNKSYLIEMTPTSKTLKDFFSKIVLEVDKIDFTAQTISLVEPSGDLTKLTFKEKKVNQGISDSVFNL